MKTLIITLSLLVSTVAGAATETTLASHSPAGATYKITDGYGTYVGHGATKLQAREQAWEGCVAQKVLAYESRNGGQTPDADTADLFIDACINR